MNWYKTIRKFSKFDLDKHLLMKHKKMSYDDAHEIALKAEKKLRDKYKKLREKIASKEYFKCPECGFELDPDWANSEIYGPGGHFCTICNKRVLPKELRKIPKEQRIDYIKREYPGVFSQEIGRRNDEKPPTT